MRRFTYIREVRVIGIVIVSILMINRLSKYTMINFTQTICKKSHNLRKIERPFN